VPRLASFFSIVDAQQLATFLIGRGVPATVHGGLDPLAGAGWISNTGRFTVNVDVSTLARARELAAEFAASRPAPEPGWEADVALPDLSILQGRVEAPCPACNHPLPLDPTISACPSCKAPADPVEVLIALHGPEILDACYSQKADPADEDLRASGIACPCGYGLTGLQESGICPECGNRYSKKSILRGLL
jgi:hypothetical protein